MYAEIHSRCDSNPHSSGKKTWVDTSEKDFKVELLTTAPNHLSSPSWCIVVKSQMTDLDSSDIVYRKLEIHFTPEDLSRLLEFATANKLLAIRAKA